MAENEEKKEDQFGLDAAGEALGYISLEQARLVAMQAARENPGNYGPQLAGTRLVFQLVEQEEGEDYYIVTLSFRPEGDFAGSPGQEQFFIEKEGAVADRQVLSLPTGGGGRRRFPIIPVVIGAGVLGVVVVAGVVFAAGGLGGGGDAEGPIAARAPTNTPAAITAPVPPVVAAPAGTPMPTPVPTSTPVPLAVATPFPIPPARLPQRLLRRPQSSPRYLQRHRCCPPPQPFPPPHHPLCPPSHRYSLEEVQERAGVKWGTA